MKNRIMIIALNVVIKCMREADGHEVAKKLSESYTENELKFLFGTFKEAEIRHKEILAKRGEIKRRKVIA